MREARCRDAFKQGLALLAALCLTNAAAAAGGTGATDGIVDRQLLDRLNDDQDFFPIGIWYESIEQYRRYKAIGINILVQSNRAPTADDLAALAKAGMYIIPGHAGGFPAAHSADTVVAWAAPDEPDNAQRQSDGSYGSCIAAADIAKDTAGLKARYRRPVFRNFGQGVARADWPGRGKCTGNGEAYYPRAVEGSDIVAYDVYPVAEVGGRLDVIAKGVRNLVRWSQASNPRGQVWNFIEATPEQPDKPLSVQQIRSEVWLSIINGSRGIVYFPWRLNANGAHHNEDGLLGDATLLAGVRRLNAEVQALAPFIKKGEVAHDFSLTTDGMVSRIAFRRASEEVVLIASETARPTHVTLRFAGPPAIIRDTDAGLLSPDRTGTLAISLEGFGVRILKRRLGS